MSKDLSGDEKRVQYALCVQLGKFAPFIELFAPISNGRSIRSLFDEEYGIDKNDKMVEITSGNVAAAK